MLAALRAAWDTRVPVDTPPPLPRRDAAAAAATPAGGGAAAATPRRHVVVATVVYKYPVMLEMQARARPLPPVLAGQVSSLLPY